MNTGWKTLCIFLVIFTITFLTLFILASREVDRDLYNNGVCPSCDVEYTLQYVTRGGANHYKCLECGKVCKIYHTVFDRLD